MARVIDSVGPMEFQPRPAGTHFEAVARAIVFQQLSGKAASTIYGRLAAALDGHGMTPDGILSLTDEVGRGVGLSGQKLRYLRDLAARCQSGEVEIERLHELEDERIVEELTRVSGIGLWTAQMFLIFRLGRPDVLPDLDLGIRKAVQRAYELESMPKPEQVRALGEAWRPYATTAALYLWRSLDAPIQLPEAENPW